MTHRTRIRKRQCNNLECPEKEGTIVSIMITTRQLGKGKQQHFMSETLWDMWKKRQSVSDIINNIPRAEVKVSQSSIWTRLWKQKFRGHATRCKPLIRSKNLTNWLSQRYRDEPQKFWTKINLYQWMEKPKCGDIKICLWSKTYKLPTQQSTSLGEKLECFNLTKSITRPQHNWACTPFPPAKKKNL